MWDKADRILKVAEKERRIKDMLDRARQHHAFFEAVCAFGFYGAESDIVSSRPKVYKRSEVKDNGLLFDLASLTKIIYSTALLLAMSEKGVTLDKKINRYLQEFSNPDLTIQDALAYRIYAQDKNAYNVLNSSLFHPYSAAKAAYTQKLIQKMRAVYIDGKYSKYSNYPAFIIRQLLGAISQSDPEEYIKEKLFKIAGMQGARFAPLAKEELEKLAPAEFQIEYPGQTITSKGKKLKAKRRKNLPQDETAHNALLRGFGHLGHAGIFATVEDMQNFANFLLYELRPRKRFWQRGFLFSDELRHALWNYANYNDASRLGRDNFNLGFRYIGDNDRIFGKQVSRAIFGHVGFSGTMLAVDPLSNSYVVMLANRCFPSRDLWWAQNSSVDFNKLRQSVCEIAFAG